MGSVSENITYLFTNWDRVYRRNPFALQRILVYLYLEENGLAEREMVTEMWNSNPAIGCLEGFSTIEQAAENLREFINASRKLEAAARKQE